MKISLISGTKTSSVESLGDNNGIGRTYKDWAQATKVWDNFSAWQKGQIAAKNVNPVYFAGRELMEQMIRKNAGGLANFMHALSPTNTKGKVNSKLKAKFDTEKAEAKKRIDANYPVDQNWIESFKVKVNVSTSNLPNLNLTSVGFQLTPEQKTWLANIKNRQRALDQVISKLYKKYPYLIYPAANEKQIAKFRGIEIEWLKFGGNPDVLNNAIKEGITKSPRSLTFNYMLGKIAQGTFSFKDTGLAARGIVSAIAKGDRFGLGDRNIWTPWNNPKIKVKPMGVNGTKEKGIQGEILTAITTVIAGLPIWAQIVTVFLATLISGFALVLMIGGKETREGIFGNGNNTNNALFTDPQGDPLSTPDGLPDDSGDGSILSSLPSWALPLGLGVGAYFLIGED